MLMVAVGMGDGGSTGICLCAQPARACMYRPRIVSGMNNYISSIQESDQLDASESNISQIPTGLSRLESPVWLSAMYVDARCSIHRIGCVVGAADLVVKRALIAAGIELRKDAADKQRFADLRDPDYMFDALVTRGLFLREVAREVGCAEQTVSGALKSPEIKATLEAAGWTPGWPAHREHVGQTPHIPFPSDDEIVKTARHGTMNGWAEMGAMRAASGLTDGQYHSFRSKCDELVAKGLLETSRVKFQLRGRPSVAYRATKSAGVS